MSATLISRSSDLSKLEADGLRLRLVQGTAYHLLIEGIPAVTPDRKVVAGTLYCPLRVDQDGRTINPLTGDHQCWWIGTPPCDATGREMTEIVSNSAPEDKGDGITTSVAFSRKRGDRTDYSDYYEKIWTYIKIIWHEAREVDPHCDPKLDKPVPAVVHAQESAFWYPDMATTRAGLGAATSRLIVDRIAVIGIGGTGSYILDLVAKTPVGEIHIFDGDVLKLHNAFRAPGAPRKDDLTEPKKVDWFGAIYDRMHKHVIRHSYNVEAAQLAELDAFNFVFLAIDDGAARKRIVEHLVARNVPFIDVGVDVALDANSALRGMCRCTAGAPDHYAHIQEVVPMAKQPPEGVYSNIQVADLNMLNAAMAVMKWKKMRGFHADDIREFHSLYNVPTHGLTKEDRD